MTQLPSKHVIVELDLRDVCPYQAKESMYLSVTYNKLPMRDLQELMSSITDSPHVVLQRRVGSRQRKEGRTKPPHKRRCQSRHTRESVIIINRFDCTNEIGGDQQSRNTILTRNHIDKVIEAASKGRETEQGSI